MKNVGTLILGFFVIACNKDPQPEDFVGVYDCEAHRIIYYQDTIWTDTTYTDNANIEANGNVLTLNYTVINPDFWTFDIDSLNESGYYKDFLMYGYREITLTGDSLKFYQISGDYLSMTEIDLIGTK